jgi:hypothetical protein
MQIAQSLIALGLVVLAVGCSSDEDEGAGTGGTSGSGGTGGAVDGGAGSAGSSNLCPDPANPLFASCIEDFLAGCYEPDLSGSCSEENGVISWADGSKYVTSGDMAGLYGPGDSAPCISVVVENGKLTATKGNQTLIFASDSATDTATITCPDGSSFTADNDQVTAFNRCVGVNCPSP